MREERASTKVEHPEGSEYPVKAPIAGVVRPAMELHQGWNKG
jgi:hypothetical protein